MGVIYEHWRTDTNECFYVGISWSNEDRRPWEMLDRSDDHIVVQCEAVRNGGCVEVKVIDCPSLTRNELGQLERFQIAYWRDLIGDRLVNRTLGGDGIHIDWTDERRQEHKELMQQYGDYISEKKVEWWSVTENKEKTRKSLLDFFQTDYGKELAKSKGEKHSVMMTEFFQTDGGKEVLKSMGEKISKLRNSPEWYERNPDFNEQIRSTMTAWARSEEGRAFYEKNKSVLSVKITAHYKTEKGRAQALYQAWWNSNVRFQHYFGA
jgi:hypothetical protein